jgi:putative ABC transport system permease protein
MVITLALGIGANTAVFTIVDQTILRPAPYANADRLVRVFNIDRASGGGGNSFTPLKIDGWQRQPDVFERFEGYAPEMFDVIGGGEPERVNAVIVTTGLLPMLGVSPRIGRGFSDTDGRPGAEPVAIISDGLWRRRFGADSNALGRTISLNDQAYVVIGIMPRRFQLGAEALWVPIDVKNAGSSSTLARFLGVARLSQGVTLEAAQARADARADQLQKNNPVPMTWGTRLMPQQVAYVDNTARTALLVLLGAVGLVLLIACANVANLFLVRATGRAREMSLRSALGASRLRLVREVLTESILISILGGAGGVLLAAWCVDAAVAAAPASMSFISPTLVEIDARVVGFTAVVTIVTGILFGLIPAIRGSRPNLDRTLRAASPGATEVGSIARLPGGLVVAEVALALLLLVGAALMMRTFARLNALDPGFNPHGVVKMDLLLPTDRYPTSTTEAAFFTDLAGHLERAPGIQSITTALGAPPLAAGMSYGVEPDTGAGPTDVVVGNATVSSNYFRVLEIPLLAGRTFDGSDRETVIVSRSLARQFWLDGSALGHRLRVGSQGTWQTVIGVVGDVEARIIDRRLPLFMYFPFGGRTAEGRPSPARRGFLFRSVIVRADNPVAALPAIKAAVWALDARQPIERVATAESLYADAFDRQRFVLVMMSLFSIIATILAAAGIFAVVSQTVAQRTREIGVRVALGATPRDIFTMILSRGMALTLVGAAIGLGGALALSRVLTSLLFEVSPFDPVSYVSVATVLVAVGFIACWLPTRRAMRIEPAVALRVE